MKNDLLYVAYTAMLTAALWIPYIVCQVMTNGRLKAANYVDPTPRPVPDWGKRANRAHINAVESFAPFAALVIILHLLGKSGETSAMWAAGFFWLRVAHAIVFWMGVALVRTLVFTAGFICVAGLFWEVVK